MDFERRAGKIRTTGDGVDNSISRIVHVKDIRSCSAADQGEMITFIFQLLYLSVNIEVRVRVLETGGDSLTQIVLLGQFFIIFQPKK